MDKGLKNVILKTALKTLLAVVTALVIAFTVLCFGFPQTVAELFEKSGNYSAAIPFAALKYTYSGSADDLARCAEDSVLANDYPNVVRFCGELTVNEDFTALCERKDEVIAAGFYRQYIFGNYSNALYLTGDADGALVAADKGMEGLEGFPPGNTYAKLAIAVAEAKDGKTALKLLDRLNGITPEENEKVSYDKVKKVISDIGV